MGIELEASFSGVVSTGSYENEKPFFRIKEDVSIDLTDDQKKARILELHSLCKEAFTLVERESNAKRIQKAFANIRFREKDGLQLPSVTSIIGWDEEYYVPEHELTQYAAQGEINHLKLEYFIKDDKWLDAKQIPEAHKFILILQKGSLKLSPDFGDMPAFLKKYPIKFIKSEEEVYNKEHLYSGRYDAYGIPEINDHWKDIGAEAVPTIFDLKRTKMVIKNMKQLSAYAKATEDEVKQLVVIPINDKTKQGFSKPEVSQDIGSYFKMFLQDRADFKKQFGV